MAFTEHPAFPHLNALAAQLHAAPEPEAMDEPSEPAPAELDEEIIAPWAVSALAEGHEEALPTGLIQAEESMAHELVEETWDDTGWEERGVGLVIGGMVLIFLAMLLACTIPPVWVKACQETGSDRGPWIRQALVQTWLTGVPAMALAMAGLGSLRRRRWSVPLIHAGGWFVALAVLIGLAVITAGVFLLTPTSGNIEHSVALSIGRLLLLVGIFGIALPLVIIAIYQRAYLPHLCRRADATARWTDDIPEPLLMLWIGCWWAIVILAAQFFLAPALPLAGQLISGAGGWGVLALLIGGFWLAQRAVIRRAKWGWWLAAALFSIVALNTAWTFWQVAWSQVLQAWGLPWANASAEPSRLAMLVSLGLYAPLLMVLLMSRGCFPVPDEPAENSA